MDDEAQRAAREKARNEALYTAAARDARITVIEFNHDMNTPEREEALRALLGAAQALKDKGLDIKAYTHNHVTGHQAHF